MLPQNCRYPVVPHHSLLNDEFIWTGKKNKSNFSWAVQGQALQLHILWELEEGSRKMRWREEGRQASVWTKPIETKTAGLTHADWPPVAPWKIDFLPLLARRSWEYSKEMYAVVSKTPQFALRQIFRLAISVPVCIWWISLSFNSVLILGNPTNGKKEERRRV